jgi:Biotin/lipoate A/B protein ligase family
MPASSRIEANTPFTADISLPPPYTLVRLREAGDAFAHAQRIAPEMGAGTLVYVGRFDLAEFAVVLEPEEPLRTARRAFYAGMAALADALIALAPPEKPMDIIWPGLLRIDAGLVGGGRLAWPARVKEDEVPPWLVFGAAIRTVSLTDEPGLNPLSTALEQEGFSDTGGSQLVESFARHFMTVNDAWQEYGFSAVARSYLPRLRAESGVRRELDENGDLLSRRAGKSAAERHALVAALKKPSWLDERTGGPKL